MENKNSPQPLIYKGFEIHCIFKYDNLKGDYNVFAPFADFGYMEPYTTLEALIDRIEDKLLDHE